MVKKIILGIIFIIVILASFAAYIFIYPHEKTYIVEKSNSNNQLSEKIEIKSRQNIEKLINKSHSFSLDKIYEFQNPSQLTIDKNKDFYIVDNSQKIIKFDKHGLKLTIGNRGKGPGEFNQVSSIAILNETIYVVDRSSRKAIIYNLNGDLIKEIKLNDENIPMRLAAISDSSFVGYSLHNAFKNMKFMFGAPISIFDKNLNIITPLYGELHPINFHKKIDYTKFFSKFCTDKNYIYVSTINEDKVELLIYSCESFNKVKHLTSNFLKTKYTKSEIEKMGTAGTYNGKNLKVTAKYKKSVKDIFPLSSKGALLFSPKRENMDRILFINNNNFKAIEVDGSFINFSEYNNQVFSRNFTFYEDKLYLIQEKVSGFELLEFEIEL